MGGGGKDVELVEDDDKVDDEEDCQEPLSEEELIGILTILASSRPDVMSSKKRNELIKIVTDDCMNNESSRKVLSEWKDSCSSLHAYRRVTQIVTQSLCQQQQQQQSQDDPVVFALCRSLSTLLGEAGDADLVESCSASLTSMSNKESLGSIFHSIAKEEIDSSSSSKSNVIPAVALGSALQQLPSSGESNNKNNNNDWCAVLLQYTIAQFSTSSELQLARKYLQTVSAEEWKTTVSPALQLKLKSHPDSILETLQGWIENLGAGVADVSDGEWIPLLLKHVTSAKEENRLVSSKILAAWAQSSTSSLKEIVKALATSKSSLAPARISVYETLSTIASSLSQQGKFEEVEESIIHQTLEGLIALVKKETKAEHRASGLRAVAEWILVAKRRKEETGYKKALNEFIQQPLGAKKITEAGVLMSALVQCIHPDLLESVAVDIWEFSGDKKKWEKSLETAVDSASTKKVVHMEGLLVLYFTVLYADKESKALPTYAAKVLSAGSTKKENPSFVYSQGMMDSVSGNEIVSMILPRVIALYTKLASTSENSSLSNLFPKGKETAATRTIAACITHPTTNRSIQGRKDQYASNAVFATVKEILTYQPQAAEGLALSLFKQVNSCAFQFEELTKTVTETREDREVTGKEVSLKGHGSGNGSHRGFDANAVRRAAGVLSRHCTADLATQARVLILMHAGTSLKNDGHQRAALIVNTVKVIRNTLLPMEDQASVRKAIAQEIAVIASNYILNGSDSASSKGDNGKGATSDSDLVLSDVSHKTALSLLVSLGGIACNFSPSIDDENDEEMQPYVFASKICIEEIGPALSSKLEKTLEVVENLSAHDLKVFMSAPGTLVRPEETATSSAPKKIGGKHLNEDEAWELQMKKELEEKKRSQTAGSTALTPEEKKLVQQQDSDRQRISGILEGDFLRVLDSIRSLCSSDIEVGNRCLPIVTESVLKVNVSICPAVKEFKQIATKSFEALTTLGTCVYEILEVHAPTLASALVVSYRNEIDSDGSPHSAAPKNTPGKIRVSALPSPCPQAAVTIYEMDHFNDTLSGPSFYFLFPVIQACLMGIRTPTGCESALKILSLHTALLAGEEYDSAVGKLRKDMAIAVLELLKYDRAMTFHDPSPFDTLVECYRTEDSESKSGAPLTTAELAPLLDERGALGGRNCRVASLRAIARIAQDHRKFVKNNPLIENRVWLNCFEKDESIRNEARKAWAIIQDATETFNVDDLSTIPKPSPLYAAPLVPLLSHADLSIAESAAAAYAHAMGMHPKSVGRNIESLCQTYIESFPTGEASSGTNKADAPTKPKATPSLVSAAPKKKPISTGLPKRKAAPKSALDVAGIGKAKVGGKKKTVSAALLKPKQERTLDQEDLVNQFKTGPVKVTEEKDSPAKIAIRSGVIRAITAFSVSAAKVEMDESTLKLLTSFLMAYGIADSTDEVKGPARDALRDIVASNGGTEQAIAFLLPHLEAVLKTGVADESSLGSLSADKVPKDVAASDRRKEGAVVALGSVALHLQGPENEEKVDNTVDMLIAALKTPSEEVQQSVADALTKLMKKGRTKDRVEAILESLLKDCLCGDTLAVRRGSAYGLSAVVKGSGIATLKKYDIVKQLEEACSSGSSSNKEGSLFAIELLSSRLGLLFEPYVIVLLPSLLRSFSDNSGYVRAAANNTTGLIMSKLSAHGVKLVMPAVLTAFDDPSWRTKQASIRMLGAMSHLAPKQLATALPKVVPKLTDAFSDTQTKVKISAQEALNEISTVVKNPEISSISPVLLKALTDPADYTIKALETLIATEFLHAIDAPSLALIVPILHRGLRDRGATTKRFGGLIAGNICTMINDPKDFVPYLPTLLPDIQSSLLDPIPDVRSTSAKALGSLTRSLGDHILAELRPWLIQKLRSPDCSSAERSGAAQGLTEVLIASGTEMVEETMRDEILPLRSHPDSCTREGVLWMVSFLPPAMGQGFTPLIDVSLPALIGGLSDDSEPVRDVAMRAGRVLIRSHGKVHVNKILPSLEAGLGDEDHRIRVASLTLLGDLLSMIGGTQVIKGDGNTQDDIRKAERAQAQIALALGTETRKRVLSGLYLSRSDSVHVVRSSALQVWKTVVSVTVRTLRDIMPVLVGKIVDDLASGNIEKTEVAGRCLGDIVSKLGDSVLPQIVPVLRNSLYSGDEHTKRGVCVGLTEVIDCSTKDQILRFIEIIIKVVQDALCDDDESVRLMAASSFQSLHSVVGTRALEEILPSLMVSLEREDSDDRARARALHGLTGILRVRSREILPYIVPRLIHQPMTTNHAKALAGVAEATGSTIYSYSGSIVPVLLEELSVNSDEEKEKLEAVQFCAQTLCGSIDESGLNVLISDIASKCSSDKASIRSASCQMFDFLVTQRAAKEDFYEQVPIIIRELVYRLNDDNADVLKSANKAFASLSKHVPAEELVKHVEFMRNLIASMVSDARRRKGGVGDGEFLLPGFNMPKGLEPLIPIYQRGILYGTPTIREVSASGLGEVIDLTSPKFLAGPLIVKMTGPLLRIVGDRNPSNVKIAILKTLGLVLEKGGAALRAFVPQFQTTFVKALSDPSRQVRIEAIQALSLLMPLSTRVDPLIKELVSGSLGNNAVADGIAVAAVQTATLNALATVLEKGGSKAKLPASIPSALDASRKLFLSPDPGIRDAAAKVMGVSCSIIGIEKTNEILQQEILDLSDSESNSNHAKGCAIRYIVASKVGAEIDDKMLVDLKKIATNLLSDDKESVREAGCVALGAIIGRSPNPKDSLRKSEAEFLKIMNNSRESLEMHRAVARGLCVALLMIEPEKRVDFMGLSMLDSCLQLALTSVQRVQFAFNDTLWLALDVENGEDGLHKYCGLANFDNQRGMKSLQSKILTRIKELTILDN